MSKLIVVFLMFCVILCGCFDYTLNEEEVLNKLRKEDVDITYDERTTSIDLSDCQIKVLETNNEVSEVSIECIKNTYTITFDAETRWKKDKLISIEIIGNTVKIEPNKDIVGRWSGEYQYNDQRYNGVMVIENMEDLVYTGYIIQAKFADWPSNDKGLDIIYNFQMALDIKRDELRLKAGTYRRNYDGNIGALDPMRPEFSFTFNKEMDLYAKPISFVHQSNMKIIFDQKGDTFDYD